MDSMEAINSASKRIETERAKHESELEKYVHQLDDAEAKIKARYAALDAKMHAKADEHGIPDASGDDVININAGGKLIDVRRGKLCQIEDSRLAALFGGRWDKLWPRDGAGRIFLDVNPDCFQAIVDYLNELAISAADNMPKGPLPDSRIITTESDANRIHQWLQEEGEDGDLSLLFRLTKDIQEHGAISRSRGSPGTHTFHTKCDNKGATISFFKTVEGTTIGGYSNASWTTKCEWYAANKAFLFHMQDGEEGERRKMKLKDPYDLAAMLGQQYCGPIFGSDLETSDWPPPSYIHLRFSPGRQYEASGNESIDFAGNVDDDDEEGRGYDVAEMEVFQVQKQYEFVSAIGIDMAKTDFSEGMDTALSKKLVALQAAEAEIDSLERRLMEEERFVQFLGVDANDIIELNVSGTIMTTRRSTLQIFQDCTLARQFDRVWSRASQDGAMLIEHSPYCFGKILDYLRLRALYAQNYCKEPRRPRVRELERERFAKIVNYYFPGDASKYVLG